ncbi:DNA primase/polymerase/helicase [Microbacterium phage OscarSo]|uniref:DNA primase/polymerase/helicase n=1 Tax=Microbacterium phage OscarSo TaxID=2985324 RepID=A0A9X9K529_9CAUD|nr:DNA primase/polymerase/helicase [Microbacterium phage OscarSo]UYL87170.1 DNA primase/polymerase/helicase [Microbacterium phage OscarSo]
MTGGKKKRELPGPIVPSPDDTLEIALSLAKVGWPVFPVGIYEDESGKRHKIPGVKWKEWATTDADEIREAWSGRFRRHHIGVFAGKAGIVVLDVDPGGDDAIAEAGLEIPHTLNYPTHRAGGRHHVFKAPEGVELTIAKGILDGVDVRSGSGLMVYYGHELKKRDIAKLAPAPEWVLVERGRAAYNGGQDRAPSATVDAFLERLVPGKPRKKIRRAVEAVPFPAGAAHDNMLEVVTTLVGLGIRGERGIGELLEATRERYSGDHPDRPRDWDNALDGSVRRLGLPPVTLELTDDEKREVAKRNDPAEIERRSAERKATFRAEKHREAMLTDFSVARPDPGSRVLEDAALADELAAVLRPRWAYSTGLGIMRYDGRVWKSAEEHALIEAVRRELVEIEVDEHTAAAMRGDNKAIDKARSLLSRARSAAVARLVVGILGEDAPTFDGNPDLLNTPTGVVDLRTGELLEHDPSFYFTKITGVGYDPEADSTMWDRALTALPADVGAWLKVRFGQMSTGYTPDDDAMVILEGAGSNGKTSWMIGARKALGDYAVTLPERLLLGDPGDHPTTLMTLMGARAGFIEELPEGRALNVKRLKDTVGTPEITARKMRQDDITFTATHGLCIATNYLPIVAETDHGTWRRLLLVRFRIRYVSKKSKIQSKRDRKGDPSLKRHFERVADAGLLKWIVEGAAEWYANGMTMPEPPKTVIADTEAWRLDADPILAYARERLVRDEGYAITATDLQDDFNTWLERRGHRRWTGQTINSRFQGHVTMDGVERKMVKWSAKVRPSRPANVFAAKPIPKTTTSWRGVRFAEEPVAPVPSEAELDAATLADLERRVMADED